MLMSVVVAVVRIPVYVPEQAVVLEFSGMPGKTTELAGDSGGTMAEEERMTVEGTERMFRREEVTKETEVQAAQETAGWRRYAEDAGMWLLAYGVVVAVLTLRWLLAMGGI